MKLADALDAASDDPFEEDGCAILTRGGIGAVANFVVSRYLIDNHSCLARLCTDYRWILAPITEGFFIDTGWEPLRLSDCRDRYLLASLRKLG